MKRMLTHENIAYRIFEYHEGLLDASQKVELMEFLHQNPELNHDFAIWAQVRLHDEPIEKPVFAKKLLRKDPVYFPWGGFARLSGEVLTFCAILFLLNTNTSEIEVKNSTNLISVVENKESIIKIKEEVAHNKYSKASVNSKNAAKKATEQERPIENDNQIAISDSLKKSSGPEFISAVAIENSEPEIIEYEPVAKEPLKTILKPEKEKPTIKRRYRKKFYPKQKFSLRPTSKIVPQNTGF